MMEGKFLRDINAGICEKLRVIGYDAMKDSSPVERVKKLKKAYDDGYITVGEFENACRFFEKTNDKGNHEDNMRRRRDLKNLKIYDSKKKKEALENSVLIDYDIPEDLQNTIDAYKDVHADSEKCIKAFQSIIHSYEDLDSGNENCIEMLLDCVLEVTQITVDKLRFNEYFLYDVDKCLIISYANTICDVMHIHNLCGYEYTCVNEENSPMVKLGKLSISLFVKVFDVELAFSYIEDVKQYVNAYLEK